MHVPSFRFLSPGIEERIIDHVSQTFSSAQVDSHLVTISIYTKKLFVLFAPCGTFKGILILAYLMICACALTDTTKFEAIVLVPYGRSWAYWHKTDGIYPFVFAEQMKQSVILLNFYLSLFFCLFLQRKYFFL